MQNDVERIKERLPLHELVASYTKLELSGNSYKARCPFHDERTPSFHVSADRDMYYCFGCGRGGDIITFVQEIEHMTFPEALQLLARKAGVTLQGQPGKTGGYEKLYQAMELATKLYEVQLRKTKPVVDYLLERGLTKETIADFRIGYAPANWTYVVDYLQTKYNFSDKELLATGLASKGKRGLVDRFRERIMFPIANHNGRVVAFSGRRFLLPDSTNDEDKMAKYVNTNDTPLYHKSKILYGLDRAKRAITKTGRVVVVEGQMDLIAAHQAGTGETVAISGTALTEDQVRLLQRFTDVVVLVLDGDDAGFKAMQRSVAIVMQLGLRAEVVVLPTGKDPADLIQADVKLWQDALGASTDFFSAWLRREITGSITAEHLSKIREELYPLLAQTDRAMYRDRILQTIATAAQVSFEAAREEYESWLSGQRVAPNSPTEPKRAHVQGSVERGTLEHLLGILAWRMSVDGSEVFTEELKELETIVGKEFVDGFRAHPDHYNEEATWAEQTYADQETLEGHVKDLLQTLHIKTLQATIKGYRARLAHSQESEERQELLTRIQKLAEEAEQIQATRMAIP